MKTKYIDPLVDFSFKKIFGSEPNKDLLIAFLNEVFRGKKHIADLTYNKNEHPGDIDNIGGAIFDLTCTGRDGETFLIEVQRSTQENLKQRMLYYASRLISDTAPKGKRKEWKYAIPEVYVIVLMDGFTLPGYSGKLFLHDICLCNRDNGEIFYEGLGFIYLELLNFVKSETELETDLDRWLFVLKNMSTMRKIPAYLRKPIFEKLFNIAEYTNLTREEKDMYDIEQKRRWDAYSIEQTRKRQEEAVKKQYEAEIKQYEAEIKQYEAEIKQYEAEIKQSKAEGRAEGIAEGIAKGIAKGAVEGEIKSLEKVVINGSKNGLTLEQLQSITGWDKNRIANVLKTK